MFLEFFTFLITNTFMIILGVPVGRWLLFISSLLRFVFFAYISIEELLFLLTNL